MVRSVNGADLAVVGGGVIGLCVAWRAAQSDLRVVVLDPLPGEGATAAAAGVLAPLTGPHDDGPVLALSRASAAAYPGFVAELESAAGFAVGFRRTGTLAVARTEHAQVLHDLHQRAEAAGIDAAMLDRDSARRLEPRLHTDVDLALRFADDAHVDPRRLATALRTACRRAGVSLIPRSVEAVVTAHGHATGVVLDDGSHIRADAVVLATGAATSSVSVPPGAVPPVTAVQGEVVTLRGREGLCRHVVRHVTATRSTWIVPRDEGRYVVGATVRDGIADPGVRAEGVRGLLAEAAMALPDVDDLVFEAAIAGSRSRAPDGLPVIGWSPVPRLLLALGHLRKGVLEAPATASACVELLSGRPTPFPQFTPDRLLETVARP
ncbi:MAG: glycine oxidase ThiO [Actinobacteria bacterium]|nr:glycine oxidase ThiO [Actinomycetota bacterium]